MTTPDIDLDADARIARLDGWDGHASDCATHNEPAFPNGPCDCGASERAASEHRISELQRLSDTATPAPWRVGVDEHGGAFPLEGEDRLEIACVPSCCFDALDVFGPDRHGDCDPSHNAALIAAVRNDLPWLLDQARIVRRLVTAVRMSDGIGENLRTRAQTAEATAARLEVELDAKRDVIAYLVLQAQSWACEAKAQRATVHEAYQAVTGRAGEPGDWHGAKPIAEALGTLRATVARLQQENADLAGEIAGLRAALRPFARITDDE